MLLAGWMILFCLLAAFILVDKRPERRVYVFYCGVSVTSCVALQFFSPVQHQDPVLLGMNIHLPLFFAYSVAFWCHTDLLKSIAETVAAYLLVSLLYLLVRDNALLSFALILTAMGAQWLITATYFQMHADDFVYDDAH
jgi:hypothetical protein